MAKNFFDTLPPVEPSKTVGFSHNNLDRRSEQRTEASLSAAIDDPAARFFLLRGDEAMLRSSGRNALFAPAEAKSFGAEIENAILLGWDGAAPRLAALLASETAFDADAFRAVSLRTLATNVVDDVATPDLLESGAIGALAQARALLSWHAVNRFCGRCGTATSMQQGGYRRDCPNCSLQIFPRTDPVAIMLAIDGDNCLMGRQARFAAGTYSCLAGFIEPGETIEDGVRREIQEEAGVKIGRVAYHASQPWPFPMSLMIGCHAEALSTEIIPDVDELEDCRWFSRDETMAMLDGRHPQGLATPPKMAIAHALVRSWAEAG